jgi:toxin ParE1/3/4
MPRMGAPKVLKNRSLAGLRSFPVSGFEEIRVYYRIHEDTLRVIRVLHGKRDVRRILEKERGDENG